MLGSSAIARQGKVLASLFGGSWRNSPPLLEALPQDIDAILPTVLSSGGGALIWRRLRSMPQLSPELAEALHTSYLQSAIQAARHEAQVRQVFTALRSAGLDPILFKGWAAARWYAEWGLRPSGDIDLLLPPEQHALAHEVVQGAQCKGCWVDFEHDVITKFGAGDFASLHERSEIIQVDDTQVRVLGAEDHLRILGIHFLKHGAWRPVWLCDVAAALESRPVKFDWNYCLGENKRRADWVLCALQLARELLGAELGDTPDREQRKKIPDWLVSSVLRQWAYPHHANLPPFENQIQNAVRRPAAFLRYLPRRWPNAVEATVDREGDFDSANPLPLQARYCLNRAAKFLSSRKP